MISVYKIVLVVYLSLHSPTFEDVLMRPSLGVESKICVNWRFAFPLKPGLTAVTTTYNSIQVGVFRDYMLFFCEQNSLLESTVTRDFRLTTMECRGFITFFSKLSCPSVFTLDYRIRSYLNPSVSKTVGKKRNINRGLDLTIRTLS